MKIDSRKNLRTAVIAMESRLKKVIPRDDVYSAFAEIVVIAGILHDEIISMYNGVERINYSEEIFLLMMQGLQELFSQKLQYIRCDENLSNQNS